jgi:hypothetical protein
MRLVYKDEGQKGKFVVTETSDRQIIEQFIDYETGYFIVKEINKIDSSDTSIYHTVIEPERGEIIEPQERIRQIGREEKIRIDEENGLKILTLRTIDEKTGAESIHEKLIDISTQKQISSRIVSAFSPNRRETIIESYKKRKKQQIAEEKKRHNFWSEEYSNKTFEEKQQFWAEYIYRQLRIQGDSGYDEYTVFNKESYEEWKKKEPQIDIMLDFVIRKLPWDRDENEVRFIVNKALGRY